MNRRMIGVAAAVVLALVGTLVLVAWVRAAEDRALAGERTVDVLVVRAAVAKGTVAEALSPSVELERVPVKVEAEGAVDSLAQLEGKVAAVDLLPGEQLVQTRFIQPEELVAQGEVDLPDGLQEVSVALEPQRVVGGKVLPGDTVGVFLSFDPFDTQVKDAPKTPNSTHLKLHKVLVTNVQTTDAQTATTAAQQNSEDDATSTEEEAPTPDLAPGGNLLVTLAVDANQAEKVVFTAEFGRIWLSSEPETAVEDGARIETRGTIYED